MSSTNKTEYLNLNAWIGADVPKMEDFNSDNEIEAIAVITGGFSAVTDNYLYVIKVVSSASKTKQVMVVLNGEVQTITVNSGTNAALGTKALYEYAIDEDGNYTLKAIGAGDVVSNLIERVNTNERTIVVDNKEYQVLDTTDFANISDEETIVFEELQVGHIDYYLLHSVGGGDGMGLLNERFFDNGMVDFLLKEREAGRIRNLGFSYHGDVRVFDYLLSRHDEFKWDFVQIQLNYLDWRHAKQNNERNTDAEYLYGELSKRGIPAIIMEPLLGGRLSNVPDNIVARFKQRAPGSSVASWAFRFAGNFPGVLTVLSGMTRMEHLQDNLRTYSPLRQLSEEEFQFLLDTAKLMMEFDTIPCNDCKYCMPCPYGIDIPAVLLHYNKCLNEGNIPQSSQSEEYRKARRAYLVGYDRSVPKLRQADHCTGCGQCNPHCPQGIDIPKELHRIDDYVEKLKQETL